MRRDTNGAIITIGDRVRITGTSCGGCNGREGVITHFDHDSQRAFVRFDQPVTENCVLVDTWDQSARWSCGMLLHEIELVRSMGNDPQQLKIEAFGRCAGQQRQQ